MAHWRLGIAYNTTLPKTDDAAYRTSIYEVDYEPEPDDLARGLQQIGPVWNDWVRLGGSYATKEAAEAALASYRSA
jgi:hypothetical protein